MGSKIVHYSKWHKGYLIRLIQVNEKYFVNVFTGKGTLHSQTFHSLPAAQSFLYSFIKSLKQF